MEADGGARAVHDIPHVEGRENVQAHQVTDRVGVIKPSPKRHQSAPVMPDQSKRREPEFAHHVDNVRGHSPFGVAVGGFVALAVPTKVRTDHSVVGDQVGGHVPPHQVSLWEAMQQDDRRTGATDRDVQLSQPTIVKALDLHVHELHGSG